MISSVAFVLAYIIIFTGIRGFLSRKGKEKFVQNSLKYKYVNEIFGGLKDIKILGKERYFIDSFSIPSKKFAMADAVSDVISEVPKYFLETIAFCCILGLIVFLIYTGIAVNDFLPILTVYAFGAYRLLPTLQKIFRAVASIRFNYPTVKNLSTALNDLPEGNLLVNGDISAMEFKNTIVLDDIVFRYPNTDKEIIKNQTLRILANTSIALVGATGCGKTTLVDIVLGLLEPLSGRILIDDIEINENNKMNWQKNLGYVPQSIYLTDDSIRNNIAFGIDPDKIDESAIFRAAKIANMHDFIMSELSDGYNTIIGERGIRLSGGQRQRIGIARAVYHDPAVLILDEATSALDGLTENAIMDAIKNLSHKKNNNHDCA
jgi:ABC-type bacteriocin/lantibiotic exporter with double-glycine peptidase domain